MLWDEPNTYTRLKCDRNQPCANCVSRNVACQYHATRGDRSGIRRGAAGTDLDSRLLRLERLVGSIAAQRQTSSTPASQHVNGSPSTAQSDPSQPLQRDASPFKQDVEPLPGRLMGDADNDQTIYVSAVHWAAICDEVTNCPSTSLWVAHFLW
jgi:hypothetical protein